MGQGREERRTGAVREAPGAFGAALGTPRERDAERRFREVARDAGLPVGGAASGARGGRDDMPAAA